MRTKINTSVTMPEYIYMPLPSGEVDVFIYKFISEDEDGMYEYETNEFRTTVITEDMVAKDPLKYLDYKEIVPTIDEKINVLEAQNEMLTECLIELANIIYA